MWSKISDDFFRHPRTVAAGRDARDLFLVSLSHCNEHLTDGFVAAGYLRRLAADAEIDDAMESARRLVSVGYWEECEGGWMVHDFLDYNPSRASVMAERQKTAERKERWQNAVRNGVPNGVPDSVPTPGGTGAPVPGPVPESRYITTALDDRRLGSTPRVYTQHSDDPPEPGPRRAADCPEPVPVVTEPPPDTPPDSRSERLSVGRRRPGRESAKTLVESLLHEADADPGRRHWRSVLLAAERDADPERPDAWRLKVLRNWLAGDGAPPPPESRSERHAPATGAPGTLPAVPARASPAPIPRLAAPRRLTPAEARDAEYRQRLADRHAARLQELEA